MMFLILMCSCLPAIYGSRAPVVGVLTEETTRQGYKAYASASYIKFVESSGGRVVPVWIGQNVSYYERVINYTNGLLLPGGSCSFTTKNGYADAARMLYNLARKLNRDNDVYYPILGICLGMEVMQFAELDGLDIRENCSTLEVALPLHFTKSAPSKFFGSASPVLMDYLKTENITFNNHEYCFDPRITQKKLKNYLVTSISYTKSSLPFAATMEHKTYPFYATQFHPEKPLFEFTIESIPHDLHAVLASQYMTDFFITETKKNDHSFPNKQLLKDSLIYNFRTDYTGKDDGADFEQIYVFSKDDFDRHQLL